MAQNQHLSKLDEFSDWLVGSKDLSLRSSRDVVCRLRRVSKFLNPLCSKDDAEIGFIVSHLPAFAKCSSSVRSQLKRSIVLYRQFIRA